MVEFNKEGTGGWFVSFLFLQKGCFIMGRPERYINSLSFQHLTNTVELDLSYIHGRGMFPTKKEINSFIADEMGVKPGALFGVQHHPRFPKVHLQFHDEQGAILAENKVKNGLMMRSKRIKIYGYRCDEPMVSVFLSGQDMSIGEVEIRRVLGHYGTVVSCERGRNVDLSTQDHFVTDGTWMVRMTPRLRDKPPETIYYHGVSGDVQTWILNYDGVGSSCVLCGVQGHMGYRCNSLAPRGGRLGRQPAGYKIWTDVVRHNQPVVPRPMRDRPVGDQGGNDHQDQSQGSQDHPQGESGQGQPGGGGGGGQPLAGQVQGGLKGTGAPAVKVPKEPVASGSTGNVPAKVVDRNNTFSDLLNAKGQLAGSFGQSLDWQKKREKNRKKRLRKKEKKLMETGVATSNSFDVLSDESDEVDDEAGDGDKDGDKEEDTAALLERMLPLPQRKLSSVLTAYGVNRNSSFVPLFKRDKVEKLHREQLMSARKAASDSNKRSGGVLRKGGGRGASRTWKVRVWLLQGWPSLTSQMRLLG